MDVLLKFLTDYKDPLTWLFGSGVVGAVLVAIWRSASWLYREWRIRQFRADPDKIFPFEIIQPNGDALRALIDPKNPNDPLPPSRIPYQPRIAGADVFHDLETLLTDKHWILILGRTGLGKSREAAELAQRLNRKGWTILNLTHTELVSAPATFPKQIGAERRLLFILDDLNSKMRRGETERPSRPGDLSQQIQAPLQERLARMLDAYEKLCGDANEIRVIATARDERERDNADEPSQWEKLEIDRFPKFWNRFAPYTLPPPDLTAQASVLKTAAQAASVKTELSSADYAQLARENDGTFSNLVENVRNARIENRPLTTAAFVPTLSGTWEEHYRRAVTRHPTACYIYDAVDLLRTVGIALYDFTVEPAARLIAGGNLWQRLQRRIQIHAAMHYLQNAEHILEPSDGQIEATRSATRVDAAKYIQSTATLSPLTRLVLQLADHHPRAMLDSLYGFGTTLYNAQQFKQAEALMRKGTVLAPRNAMFHYNLGLLLHDKLNCSTDAEAEYRQAIALDPNLAQAHYNLGVLLAEDAARTADAEAAYRQAIALDPNLAQAHNNLGVLLAKDAARTADAEAAYRQAIALDPNNDSNYIGIVTLLRKQNRESEALPFLEKRSQLATQNFHPLLALASVHKKIGHAEESAKFAAQARALIKPDDWHNLACLESVCGNVDAAIENLRRAAQSDSFDRAWVKRDLDLEWIRDDPRFKEIIGE